MSATTVYDACIRADAKSAFASTSSRQSFQVVQVGLCRLRSASRLVPPAPVHGSVSAITMYDVCNPADAKSASAGTSSSQPSQVAQIRLCRLRSSRLVSSARVRGSVSAITVYNVCIRKNVIASTISGRTSLAVSALIESACVISS